MDGTRTGAGGERRGAQVRPLPRLRPMLAVPGGLPSEDRDFEYGYEFKWDGVRALVYLDGRTTRLWSRSDRDITAVYPELTRLHRSTGRRRLVLDGEVVAFDGEGRPDFGTLQRRMHVQRPGQALLAEVPVYLLLFDLLHMDGRDTMRLGYADRRAVLEGIGPRDERCQVPSSFHGGGSGVLAASLERGLEGVVAKRLDAPYRPGRRSPNWIKVKNFRTQEVVVGGWRPGAGRRRDTIGSLLLGLPGEGGLRYVGHVGTGFSDEALESLTARLARLEQADSPFERPLPRAHARDARWVRPELVGEVRYGEWTQDGMLRHPSWRGLRPDVDPGAVRPEPE
ncbi:non-homologous end-joining DNA ligase [Allonocardiopsis opalescens]|uniref:DNA ligase (ATP) n=1 Tax=Allonocardiopsis opalescens TaxID=1144618 RepID=A0A2T0PV75_9ACTN|nr:non-homologous end-joining DNA ligase [Allonocardiopsis opalescens]PRX95432.1 bifunctional non-homologous end joining protein LigD [Allonocardiopsis opalescens]